MVCLLHVYYSVLWGCSKEQKQAAVWTKPLCHKGSKANRQIAHILQRREERGLRSSEIKNGQIFHVFLKESEASKIFFGRRISSHGERSTEYVFHVIKWDHKLILDDKLEDREELEKVGEHYMVQVDSFSFKTLYEGINLGIWFMSCQLHSIGENLMGPENSNYSCQCNISI